MTEKERVRVETQETLRLRKIGCVIALAILLIIMLAIVGIIHIITIL